MSKKEPLTESEALAKSVKDAGNSVFAIGMFNLVATTLLYAFSGNGDIAYLALVIIGNGILSIIMITLGNKIKRDALEDLEGTFQKVKNASTYTWVMAVLCLFLGAFPGIFTILALFDLTRAKKKLQAEL